ncbi:hypothetical protein JCM8097_007315 [Rhodosporidiobolus ruineniae]
MESGKRKKPPACDRCKAKRVLCHPSPQGCPRCLEKGIVCTTTPVVRRRPQRKPDPSSQAAAALPLLATPIEGQAAPAPPPLPTVPVPTPISSSTSADWLPQPPSASITPPSSTTSAPFQSNAIAPAVLPTVEITPTLAKHLFDAFSQTPQSSHPALFNNPLFSTLDSLSWNVQQLPLPARALAYAIFALSAQLSHSPSVIGIDGPVPSSFADVGSFGPDLRQFGRRRMRVCQALRRDAVWLAKEADVFFEPSCDNAATCMILNALDSTDETPPPSRVWHAVYLSHIRAQAQGTVDEPIPLHAVRWACHFAIDGLADIAEGRMGLTRADEMLYVGGEPPDPAQYMEGLEATLSRPVDRTLWPDLKPYCLLLLSTFRGLCELLGAHAKRRPADEHAFLRHLDRLHYLRLAAVHFSAIMDRLLEPYDRNQPSLFLNLGAPKKSANRAVALGAMRGFVIWAWASTVLPVYEELQRRSRLNHENPAASFESTDPQTRLAAERLEMYRKQARDLCYLALDDLVDFARNGPLTYITHNRRATFPSWAAFLLEELQSGAVVLDERLASHTEALITSLYRIGYSFASPTIDALITQLDAFLQAYRLANPPVAPFSFTAAALDFANQLKSPDGPPPPPAAPRAATVPVDPLAFPTTGTPEIDLSVPMSFGGISLEQEVNMAGFSSTDGLFAPDFSAFGVW